MAGDDIADSSDSKDADDDMEDDDMEDAPEDFIELDDFVDDLMGPPDLIGEDSDDMSSDLGAIDDGPHMDLDDPHWQRDDDSEEEHSEDNLGGITDANTQEDDAFDSNPSTPEGYYNHIDEDLEEEVLDAALDFD